MKIEFFKDERIFLLSTLNSTYAFKINAQNCTQSIYYGVKVNGICDLPTDSENLDVFTHRSVTPADMQEYKAYGGENFGYPAAKITFDDGTRDVCFEYESYKISGNTLEILLCDKQYNLSAALIYKVLPELDIIERSVRITNNGHTPCTLESAFSANVRLPRRKDYRLTYFSGRWSKEYGKVVETVKPCERVLETRTGFSGPDAIPFIMLDEDGRSDYRNGNVYFMTLIWSGNHKFIINKENSGYINITAGVNDFDFGYYLENGQSFETPVLSLGFSHEGFDGVTHRMHDYERRYIMRESDANRLMPVVFNAYGTYFSAVNESRIMPLIDRAAEIGAELFVLDAGWFGNGDVDSQNYRDGLGDWNINKTRFPHGLEVIANKVHESGMKFGIWLEPEVVSPNSNCYKEHPEWILGFENRQTEPENARFVLNFALDEVKQYVTDHICRLIEMCKADYFKIDFNTYIYQTGNKIDSQNPHAKETAIRYVRNLYDCYNYVVEKYPHIIFENCAGGGQRVDLGMLKFSGRINRSDNQDPYDVLEINEDFSGFVLPKLAGGGCHISNIYTEYFNHRVSPRKFQALLSMMGSMAIGLNLNEITETEKKELKEYSDYYKSIRHITNNGDFYVLNSAHDNFYAAYEFLSKDKTQTAVFVFVKNSQYCEYPDFIKLRGLKPDSVYSFDDGRKMSGRGLENVGFKQKLSGDMCCEVFLLNESVD